MTWYTPDPRDLGGGSGDGAGSQGRRAGRQRRDDRPGPVAPRGGDPADPVADLVTPAREARYSRWDGSQHIPDLDADEILAALSDDVMAEGDLAEALRRLMERGWRSGDPTRPDLAGLQDLMDRLVRRREELRERFELGDVLGDIRRELDEIVAEERAGVEQRLERSGDETAGPMRQIPRRNARCATSPPSGSIGSMPCRATWATGSAICASTTSSNRTHAGGSTRWWSGSAGRCWISSSAG